MTETYTHRSTNSWGRGVLVLLTVAATAMLVVLALTLVNSRAAGSNGSAYGGTDSGAADGATGEIPDGTYLDVTEGGAYPAIARLDPQLRSALKDATDSAAYDDVSIGITSGWRSEAYQVQLLEDEIAEVGEFAASKIVADPSTSKHVTGAAVDIGPTDAMDWMQQYGDQFGLCQIYANEPWHYELVTTPGGDCPPLKSDATQA